MEGVAEGGAGGWDVSRLIWWLSWETVELIAWSESITFQSIWSYLPTRIPWAFSTCWNHSVWAWYISWPDDTVKLCCAW